MSKSLSPFPSAHWKNYSTQQALVRLVDEWGRAL